MNTTPERSASPTPGEAQAWLDRQKLQRLIDLLDQYDLSERSSYDISENCGEKRVELSERLRSFATLSV